MVLSTQLAKSANRALLLANLSHTLVQFTPMVRYQSGGRQDCGEELAPSCGSENLKKKPCDSSKAGAGKSHKEKPAFKSMWENPECCKDLCPDVLPRFDELYYKPSDKAKRKYVQTWVECPEKKIVKKPICSFENLIYPPMEKRPRKRADTAKSQCNGDADLMKCFKVSSGKCPKITLAGCRGVRNPPKCKRTRVPLDCKKICCPYPSFSECKKDPTKTKHPVECNCLAHFSLCEVFRIQQKLGRR